MRVDKPGGSWLHNPRVHLSPAECCDGFALVVPAWVAAWLFPCWDGGSGDNISNVNGKPRERKDLAVTLSRCEL